MNEIEEIEKLEKLEADNTAAIRAYLDASHAVNKSRYDFSVATHAENAIFGTALVDAVAALAFARINMFSATSAYNAACDAYNAYEAED